ncbi:WD40 repeat protein [Streptomyces sp. TE3672]
MAFSPDGRALAATGHDDAKDTGVVRFWDMPNPTHPVLLGQPRRLPGAAWMVFSPDAAMAAGTSIRRFLSRTFAVFLVYAAEK